VRDRVLCTKLGLTPTFRSLARDNKHAAEKEQVIKLIRAIVEIGSEKRGDHAAPGLGTVPLSEAVMRALVAVAEHPEDPFKSICILTLTEIRTFSS
jgi:rapamycin-insensitive companion of mTOR